MDNSDRFEVVLKSLNNQYPGKIRLSVAETAAAIGVARQTIYDALHASTLSIPAVYIGRRPGFLITDITRHLAGEGRV